MHYITIVLKGMVYGVTHVVPGLGGSLVLIMMGIYEEFVEAIGGLFTDRAGLGRRLRFLVPLGIGMVLGIIIAAVVIAGFLDRFPVATKVFFMGLLLGTISSVLRLHGDMRPTPGRIAAALCGIGAVVAVHAIEARIATGSRLTLDDVERLPGVAYNLLMSFLGGGASVTPGMDGSTVLILGGTYQPILEAVRALTALKIHWLPLMSTVIGVILGMVTFSKTIHAAIMRSPAVSYYCVLGLILGSIYALWPNQPANVPWWVLPIVLALGAYAAVLLGRSQPQED